MQLCARKWLLGVAPGLVLTLAARQGSRADPLLGRAGEAFAANYMRRRGARILGQRVRTPEAELDLVAQAGDQLLVIEVKTGRSRGLASLPEDLVPIAGQGPGRRLSPEQVQRLHESARWLGYRSRGRSTVEVLLAEIFADPKGFKHRCVLRPVPALNLP
ncbi:hypothetical protein CMO84_06050 [Candidatus Woesearchaeota archaeon]|nr:hypothetical protein [Candidatus Woesearchaeota archaeon]